MGPATPRRQAGFTLIEMLVVIGIMLLLMGLSIGAMNTRRTDKLVAAEQLVADMVRQGRHTARTSGAPVLLRIDQNERTISGVVRTPAWGTTFDGGTGPSGNIDGYAGRGLLISDDTDDLLLPIVNKKDRFGLPNTIGFYLSCAVRPPAQGGGYLPLICVTRDHSMKESIGGLLLRAVTPRIQDYSLANPKMLADPNNQPPPVYPFTSTAPVATNAQYELFGWLGDGTNDPLLVSNLDRDTRPADLPDTTSKSHPSVPPNPTTDRLAGWDFAQPLVGGQWMQVGLLFDGTQLILFHNGRRVGTTAVAGSFAGSGDEFVAVGALTIDGNVHFAGQTVFDNIRVDRLARSRTVALPVGVAPAQNYRILCLPDGRVEVSGGDGTALILRDTTSQRLAEVSVTATGNVTSVIRDPSL